MSRNRASSTKALEPTIKPAASNTPSASLPGNFAIGFFMAEAITTLLFLLLQPSSNKDSTVLERYSGVLFKAILALVAHSVENYVAIASDEPRTTALFFATVGVIAAPPFYRADIDYSAKMAGILISSLAGLGFYKKQVVNYSNAIRENELRNRNFIEKFDLTHIILYPARLSDFMSIESVKLGARQYVSIRLKTVNHTQRTNLVSLYGSISQDFLGQLLMWHLQDIGLKREQVKLRLCEDSQIEFLISLSAKDKLIQDFHLERLAIWIESLLLCRKFLAIAFPAPKGAQLTLSIKEYPKLVLSSTKPFVKLPEQLELFIQSGMISKEGDAELKRFAIVWTDKKNIALIKVGVERMQTRRIEWSEFREEACLPPLQPISGGPLPDYQPGQQRVRGQRERAVSPNAAGLFEPQAVEPVVYDFGDYGIYDSTKEVAKGDATQIHRVELENGQQIFIKATEKVCEELGFEIFDDVQVASRRQGQKGLILNIERPEEIYNGNPVHAKLKNLENLSAVATHACKLTLPDDKVVVLLIFDAVMPHNRADQWPKNRLPQFEKVEQPKIVARPREFYS